MDEIGSCQWAPRERLDDDGLRIGLVGLVLAWVSAHSHSWTRTGAWDGAITNQFG